ncbi:hypothetical protein MGYG_09215 [Nannizzia gypsea CBS 118893]|uniref:Integrase catalytic domain-containing protein n=1 Tax=Arthroderma gypseum (strain ATCC MYA-4604 / CBS 118893) TaxID=535722 RepID=E4V789_ARTGP|nr:hypothetical protein MGYG_09215 [Nannizzia gypsea CBS 118893]EFQ96955.1 hypothetical protein MGYG_09215 [Nannizzia gypsea CBS 118893]
MKKTDSTRITAYILLRQVFANHGLPDEIISDRDTRFMSKFWMTLTERMGIEQKASTAYHPQTDGQSERMNQTVEQYLRCYINHEQNNWVELLPMAQLAYNGAKAASTGITPFFANYGREPETIKIPRKAKTHAREAEISAEKLRLLHENMKRDSEFLSYRMSNYYDKQRMEAPTFERGEKVFLLRRNIKTLRPNDKLDHRKIGPFKILEKTGQVNYKLQLPEHMKIHPVFHVSLIEKAPQNAKPYEPEIQQENQEQEYEVERILDEKRINGKIHYLVKWKGYDDSENTYEPMRNLQNATQAIEKYHQRRDSQEEPREKDHEKRRSPKRPRHAE